ncbi:SDR family NAD(P)-dependent oxidoreductase [Spirosoma sp. HMF4905]|uniref:SDR family NAD(P)-dependent oxidoreductase n=1 Tax=Spirosoma arboris TaxID=2682092 RepID=A0A7K1SKX5_9BACT|nr:SDR family NAD(P)-dependent oxidoreductase [Spirosoma arboris]MVM34343.1 SDR family NAD(P)-dependent oxidoreductase [Spirosoma arboris]
MKSVLITGASGNLGASLVDELHKNGYHIIATLGSEKDQGIFSHLPNVESHVVNLLESDSIADFLSKIDGKPIQAAALLVGGFTAGGIHETDVAMLDKMYRLNFITAFNLVKPLLTTFEAQGGGQFIFIGARPAIAPEAGKNLVAYALSKSLIFELASLVNAHGKDKQISATVIVPSTIDTPINREAMPDADPTKWVKPEDISKTIAFVLSDTGRTINEPVLKLYNQA